MSVEKQNSESIVVCLINEYNLTTFEGMCDFLDIVKSRVFSLIPENKDFHIHNTFCKHNGNIEVTTNIDSIESSKGVALLFTNIKPSSLHIDIDSCRGIDRNKLITLLKFPY